MQMQVIVSACFSLYTFESNLGVAQITVALVTTSSTFYLNKQPL